MRNFFLQKAALTSNLSQAFFALRGLKVATKAAPFLHLQNQATNLVKYKHFDMVGALVADSAVEPIFHLNDIPVTGTVSTTGTVNINLEGVRMMPGHYYLSKMVNGVTVKSEESFKVSDSRLSFSTLAFELTKEGDPSDDLIKMN